MKFIEVTRTSGDKIFINVNDITKVHAVNQRVFITTNELQNNQRQMMEVIENYEDLKDMILK